MLKRLISLLIILSLTIDQAVFAQVAPALVVPGYLQGLLNPERFRPVLLRSIKGTVLFSQGVSPSYTLLLDKGDAKDLSQSQIEATSKKLLEYFKIGLTLPNSMFWVNLRPDDPSNIIDPYLEKTDLGKVLLEADLELKKDMSLFTSPDTKEGKAYWDKLYNKAEELYGSQDIEVPTVTRPWIVPGEIIIGESPEGAYVYKATLKVMLEQDWLGQRTAYSGQRTGKTVNQDPRQEELNQYSTELIKQQILPKLTREINSSKKYASLRQVYYSLILAQYYKNNNKIEPSPLFDSKNLTGLTSTTTWNKDTYYQAYSKSFSQGEYNKEETVQTANGITVRQYFSGGIRIADGGVISTISQKASLLKDKAVQIVQLTDIEGGNDDLAKQLYMDLSMDLDTQEGSIDAVLKNLIWRQAQAGFGFADYWDPDLTLEQAGVYMGEDAARQKLYQGLLSQESKNAKMYEEKKIGDFQAVKLLWRSLRGAGFPGTKMRGNPEAVNDGCFICVPNIATVQKGARISSRARDVDFVFLAQPFPIVPAHVTLTNQKHVPQVLDQQALDFVLGASSLSTDFSFGFNGLNAAASIPEHMHFQVFAKEMPIEKIPLIRSSEISGAYEVGGMWPIKTFVFQGQKDQIKDQVWPLIEKSNKNKTGFNLLVTHRDNILKAYFIPRQKEAPDTAGEVFSAENPQTGFTNAFGVFEMAGFVLFEKSQEFNNFNDAQNFKNALLKVGLPRNNVYAVDKDDGGIRTIDQVAVSLDGFQQVLVDFNAFYAWAQDNGVFLHHVGRTPESTRQQLEAICKFLAKPKNRPKTLRELIKLMGSTSAGKMNHVNKLNTAYAAAMYLDHGQDREKADGGKTERKISLDGNRLIIKQAGAQRIILDTLLADGYAQGKKVIQKAIIIDADLDLFVDPDGYFDAQSTALLNQLIDGWALAQQKINNRGLRTPRYNKEKDVFQHQVVLYKNSVIIASQDRLKPVYVSSDEFIDAAKNIKKRTRLIKADEGSQKVVLTARGAAEQQAFSRDQLINSLVAIKEIADEAEAKEIAKNKLRESGQQFLEDFPDDGGLREFFKTVGDATYDSAQTIKDELASRSKAKQDSLDLDSAKIRMNRYKISMPASWFGVAIIDNESQEIVSAIFRDTSIGYQEGKSLYRHDRGYGLGDNPFRGFGLQSIDDLAKVALTEKKIEWDNDKEIIKEVPVKFGRYSLWKLFSAHPVKKGVGDLSDDDVTYLRNKVPGTKFKQEGPDGGNDYVFISAAALNDYQRAFYLHENAVERAPEKIEASPIFKNFVADKAAIVDFSGKLLLENPDIGLQEWIKHVFEASEEKFGFSGGGQYCIYAVNLLKDVFAQSAVMDKGWKFQSYFIPPVTLVESQDNIPGSNIPIEDFLGPHWFGKAVDKNGGVFVIDFTVRQFARTNVGDARNLLFQLVGEPTDGGAFMSLINASAGLAMALEAVGAVMVNHYPLAVALGLMSVAMMVAGGLSVFSNDGGLVFTAKKSTENDSWDIFVRERIWVDIGNGQRKNIRPYLLPLWVGSIPSVSEAEIKIMISMFNAASSQEQVKVKDMLKDGISVWNGRETPEQLNMGKMPASVDGGNRKQENLQKIDLRAAAGQTKIIDYSQTGPIDVTLASGTPEPARLRIYKYQDLPLRFQALGLNANIGYFIVEAEDNLSGFKALRDGETIDIGRHNPGRFILSKYISREHLRVERKADTIIIRELGSANGTILEYADKGNKINDLDTGSPQGVIAIGEEGNIDIDLQGIKVFNNKGEQGYLKIPLEGVSKNVFVNGINPWVREIISIDTQRSDNQELKGLLSWAQRVGQQSGVSQRDKAKVIFDQVRSVFAKSNKSGGGADYAMRFTDDVAERYAGREIGLDLFIDNEAGVCRHQAILYVALAKAAGLNVSPVRGTVANSGGTGRHQWVEVFCNGQDGKLQEKIIIDPFNNFFEKEEYFKAFLEQNNALWESSLLILPRVAGNFMVVFERSNDKYNLVISPADPNVDMASGVLRAQIPTNGRLAGIALGKRLRVIDGVAYLDGGNNPGGIDFRALPMNTQPTAALGSMVPKIDLKVLELLAQNSKITDLDQEWREIEKQILGQQMPYQRIKEYAAVCIFKKDKHLDNVAHIICEILKLEEEATVASTPEMKEILAIVGNG